MRRMARAFIVALAWLLAGLCVVRPAHAQAKHAFVVGIDNYDAAVGPLRKAVSDAKAVAGAFKDLGFNPTLVENGDADRLKLLEAWRKFVASVREGDSVAFYFSGHGMQIGPNNYLLPRDMLETAHGAGVATNFAISFWQLIDDLAARKPRVVMLILDACRNNPFNDPAGKKAYGLKSGLVEVKDPPRGTFIMYSAGANELALDWLTDPDPDPNSVYTRHLLQLLKTPGLSLVDIATRVREAVAIDARTKHVVRGRHVPHRQVPAYYDGLDANYVLREASGRPTVQQSSMLALPPPSSSAVTRSETQGSPPAAPSPCDDTGFAEAHAANSKEAFEAYLPKAAPKCAAATRLALRDLRDWDAIEKAAGLPQGAAKSARGAASKSGATAAPATPPGLRTQIQRYLTEDDYKPAPRKAGEATALLRQIESSERMASCFVYAPAAVKLGKDNAEQLCGFRGEEWDLSLDIQQSWCMDVAHGPEKANERLKVREGELARCKRAKTDKADWEKIAALKPGADASASPASGRKVRSASPSDAAYATALADYIKRYEPDGAFLDVARKELAGVTHRQREAVCRTFATTSVALATRNAADPACKLEGPAWDRSEPVQYKACMEFEDTKRDAELKQRTTTIDTCTWARRNDEAWQVTSAARSIEATHDYIVEWQKGPHMSAATALLKELCEPKWAEAKKGDKWAPLDLFAHGYCAPTDRQSEAAKLLKALDKRHWATATASPQSAKGYKDYLKSFNGEERGCGSSLVMRAARRSWADELVGLPKEQTRQYWTCGEHVDAAVKAIVDFETWNKAHAKGAGCQEMADYIQHATSELGGSGRFVKQAKDKLREAIKAEEAKSKAAEAKVRSSGIRNRFTGTISVDHDEGGDTCKQHKHLLSDISRHGSGAYRETFGAQRQGTQNPLTGAPILDPSRDTRR